MGSLRPCRIMPPSLLSEVSTNLDVRNTPLHFFAIMRWLAIILYVIMHWHSYIYSFLLFMELAPTVIILKKRKRKTKTLPPIYLKRASKDQLNLFRSLEWNTSATLPWKQCFRHSWGLRWCPAGLITKEGYSINLLVMNLY